MSNFKQTSGGERLYDVVAVRIDDNSVRLLAEGKTKPNAEAIVNMAIARRGLDTEFYSDVPAGTYRAGDKWGSHDAK
jgi:hypothetical protein